MTIQCTCTCDVYRYEESTEVEFPRDVYLGVHVQIHNIVDWLL